MTSVKEEFGMYMKTFIDFDREELVEVQCGEDRLSSALTVADFFWKADSMTVVTRQQGMELDWVIGCSNIIQKGSRFIVDETGGGQIIFIFYDLFSENDPYWE